MLVSIWTVVFLLHGLLYLALVPPWQAPDEPTSFELLLTMEAKGRLVSIQDQDLSIQRDIIASMERSSYWERGGYGPRPRPYQASFEFIYPCCYTQLHRPPLYQLLLLPVARLGYGWPVEQRLMLVRAATLLFGAATVAIASLIGSELAVVNPGLAFVFPALIALHPQFAYSNATFNADNLIALLSAIVCWLLLRIFKHGISLRRLLGLGLIFGLGIFTKRTILFILPSVGLACLWQGWSMWREPMQEQRRKLLGTGAIAVVTAGLLLLPSIRNYMTTLLVRYVIPTGLQAYINYIVAGIIDPSVPLGIRLLQAILFINRTFWGNYGWHYITLPGIVQQLLLALTVGTWVTTMILLVWYGPAFAAWIRRYLWLCAFAVLTTLTLTWINVPYPGLPQGRYVFPVLLPILLLISVGWCGWWPKRWVAPGVVITIIALLAFDLYCIVGLLVPGFYL